MKTTEERNKKLMSKIASLMGKRSWDKVKKTRDSAYFKKISKLGVEAKKRKRS